MTTTKPAVDELMTKAFAPGRDPRSQEYKQAVLSIVSLRIDGVRHALPYELWHCAGRRILCWTG
jgi:hypothetical protein